MHIGITPAHIAPKKHTGKSIVSCKQIINLSFLQKPCFLIFSATIPQIDEINLSDFDYILRQILKNYSQYKDIIEKNKKNVCENHTWDNRIQTITSIIQKY